jgi:HEAT repeat protein
LRLTWVSQEGAAFWRGEIVLPEESGFVTAPAVARAKGTLGAPSRVVREYRENAEQPAFMRAFLGSKALREQLKMYRPAEVLALCEKWMAEANDAGERDVWAMEAAAYGSEKGKSLVLKMSASARYEDILAYVHALLHAMESDPSAEWAVDAALAAMEDDRALSPEDAKQYLADNPLPDGSVQEPVRVGRLMRQAFIYVMGEKKVARAVPALLRYLRDKVVMGYAVEALGKIGDARAKEPLLALLRSPEGVEYVGILGRALEKLGASEAVELLIPHAGRSNVPRVLADFGDKRAIPALERAAAGESTPEKEDYPVEEARVALVKLRGGDVVAKYCRMLAAPGGEHRRTFVIEALASFRDVRAVAALAKATREDGNGWAVRRALGALGEMRMRESVEALLECFDAADGIEKRIVRDGLSRAQFEEAIVESLQNLTGEAIGIDKAAWRKWWEDKKIIEMFFAPRKVGFGVK